MNGNNNQQQVPGLLERIGTGLQGLGENPLFNIGMGLLSAQYDPRVNPFEAAVSGLLSAQEQQTARERRERLARGREEAGEFYDEEAVRAREAREAEDARRQVQNRQQLMQVGMNQMSPVPGYFQPQMSAVPPLVMDPAAAQQYNYMPSSASRPFVSSLNQPLNDFARRMAFKVRLGDRG